MAVHYCEVCRRTSFSGRRHLYSAAHRRRLQEALDRLQEEVAAARAAAAAAGDEEGGGAVRPYDPAEHDRRHRRETARFWRENRAEAALRERFVVPTEEYERFARALERALAAHQQREEERIQQVPPAPQRPAPPHSARPGITRSSPQMAAGIREAERRQRETVRATLQKPLDNCCLPHCESLTSLAASWFLCSRDSSHDTEQPGPSGMQTGPDLNWMESGQVLTFIGHQARVTRAKPPWLTEEEDGNKQQIGPSYEEFLKQKEKQKLKKLPAERVGANFDHTSQTGDSWLPSFGRVWNHGRRWQSR
ncbi:CCD84 protein, partial [Podargus strigoides]|nr:CCD84 protein [Podargus strigoides]